ncbi:hypothetical protein AX14_012772 [Amanita brunnescens Koide BX004]|nr:hypothetical protein AX14_012772 [Amanita brunnescens Koide BX004]
MNAAKENLHHELYIRAASAAKRNAPLKLHAHVVGKFQVERQLDNDVRNRLRQSTKTLQAQRQERGIVQLETPLVPPSKSSKKTTAARPSHLVVDHVTSSSRESTSASNRNRKELSKSMRRRMMQFLAVSDRTSDEILRLLGGPECSSSDRSNLLDLLEQVAEPPVNRIDAGSKSSKIYRLKLKSWLEVRPLEWDWSSEQERSTVSTKFENALQKLNIPDSDNLWGFSARRSGREIASISSATNAKNKGSTNRTTTSISKAGGALLSTKEKRPKAARLDNDDQIGKDESRHGSKVTTAQARSKAVDTMSLPPVPKASTPLRKPPGSGFRSGKASPQITNSDALDASHRDMADVGAKAGQSSSSRKQAVASQASQARQPTMRSDFDRGRDRSVTNNVQDSRHDAVEGNAQKRRISNRNPDEGGDVFPNEPVLKKRKVGSSAAEMNHEGSTSKESKARDQDVSKKKSKSGSSIRYRSKDDAVISASTKLNIVSASPLDNAAPSRNISSKLVTSSKRNRLEPIYTSSEDDTEPMDPNKDSLQALPADHASLRRRYNNSYGEYLTAFYKLVTLRDKIDGILRNKDDADLELIDPDEFGPTIFSSWWERFIGAILNLTNSHTFICDNNDLVTSMFRRNSLPSPDLSARKLHRPSFFVFGSFSGTFVPLRERSHFDIQKDSRNVLGSNFTSDDALCPGCGTSAIREEGGLVVAFGQSFFHVDCFRCAKCHEKVTADTNLLLLSDGSPVCANCTYCCTICQQAIHDEAIMAGDDSFHAHCFKCKICKNRIDELTYARTSHGIYCMDCHNDRVARNRRHAQKKAEMATSGSGGSLSNKPRSSEGRKLGQETERLNTIVPNHTVSPRLHTRVVDDHPQNLRVDMNGKLKPDHYISDAFFPRHDGSTTQSVKQGFGDNQHTILHLSPNVVSRSMSTELERSRNGLQSLAEPIHGGRRRSMDDGVRPLDISLKQSEDEPVTVRTNDSPPPTHADDYRSLQPSPTDARSPISNPLSPTTSTRLSVSSSPLPLDETITISRPQSQTISSAGYRQQAQLLATSSVTPSLRTSTYQSCEVDDNTVILDLAEIHGQGTHVSSPPRGMLSHKERSSATRFSDPRLYSENHLTPPDTRNGRRSPQSVSEADVPHGVESEIDSEIDVSNVDPIDEVQKEVPPPPKDDKTRDTSIADASDDIELDTSTASHDSAAHETESFPMARAPRTAYIAPALPPIRFSMNSTDFADLLTSVSGLRIRETLTSERSDSGMIQASPDQTLGKQADEFVTARLHERLGDSIHPMVNGSTVERARNIDKVLEVEPFHETATAEIISSEPRSDQRNLFNIIAPTRSSDSATGPTPSSSDKQGEVIPSPLLHLKDLLRDENEDRIFLDRKLTEALLGASKIQHDEYVELKARYDSIKRTSKQYMEGLTVAQTEYDRELKARRDAEAEVTRLRVLLSAQTARLTAISNDNRRQEQKQKSMKDAHDSLVRLENDLSRLIVQRDIMLSEVQELLNVKSSGTPTSFVRTLTQSMDSLKSQYQRDLVPLKQERQLLARELADLKASRDALLEETTALNARNEELAILNQEYARRTDVLSSTSSKDLEYGRGSQEKTRLPPQQVANAISLPSVNTPSYPNEEESRSKGNQRADNDTSTPSKKFKWPGYKGRDTSQTHNINELAKNKPRLEHNFTQMSILRFTRCDRCGDKMWGSQLRCTHCHMSIHIRCAANVHPSCTQSTVRIKFDHVASGPSMFGRDLTEQATADNPGRVYLVPRIVDKCIEAVETSALDYEGIYRKNGGASQSRLITQLFERGDYSAFDLRDPERFPDICSVTSVLKNYFRSLPVPLLTFDLYEDFISAAEIPDPTSKYQVLQQLVNKLPPAHYQTLQKLVIHLHCIHENRDENRMNARNLGVVFGPTLMKSRYPSAEFDNMAEKAHSVGWLIENARSIFSAS